ncbi:MAG: PAS domain S-box protein, partial [Bacteroidales bacterium]|nr:PAS domain S-box protein [Bacteroidales bacterium]
ALKESENKFRGITEQIQDVIYMTDKAGRIVYISPASLEIFGYSQDEMLGKPFTGFLEKSQIPLALKKFRFSMKTNQTERDLILTMKRKDNSLFQGELKATLFFEGNKVLGSLGLIRDITDRIKAERALRETTQKLRDLATYIQEVREEERKEIAQDLHDDLGQKLTAMNIDLSWIACRLPADFPEVSDKLYKVQELLLETVTRVKQISSQLRPSILDDLGIAAAIVWQANEFSARTDTPCIVNILPDDLTMPSTTEIQVFRIVQESLTNIMRHAEATNVMISLIQKESSWRLRIKDNGIGFSQEETAMKQSFGIIGMEERTHLCGGTFSIAGEPDKGTEIIVEIPRT